MADVVFKIIVSSTFRDLREWREVVRDAALGQGMLPLMMEHDAAIPDRGIISNSLAKVDEADAYVVLISNYRYGQVITDPALNPESLSVTELEFGHAEKKGLPICVFLLDENFAVSPVEQRKEAQWQNRLLAFRARAQHPSRIFATFTSAEDLKAKVVQTLARLRTVLQQKHATTPSPTDPTRLPAPPAFVARPPYTPGHPFQGRARELDLMRDWATASEPVLVFEAIGGMGKSTVTWEWVLNHAASERTDWSGRLWYSFYERGADMRDFTVTALAYMTGEPPEALRSRPEAELTRALLDHLSRAPWLLVLDGLERVLAAYHRADAAQVADDQVQAEGDTGMAGRQPRDGIRPRDDDLLRHLAGATPSKILVSSRLMPRALLNASNAPVPGVRREVLRGLAPEDAEAMLRRAGIQGDGARMRHYLVQEFDCHPLVVGFVAGLVRKAPWARMDFDRWVDDRRGGQAVNLADPDLRQRQTNILALAFDALTPEAREVLARMGMLSGAVDLEVLEALNPQRPDPPREVEVLTPPDEDRDVELRYLERQLQRAEGRQRIAIEERIVERKQTLQSEHEAVWHVHAAHQSALEAWRKSPALRWASDWLHATLADLEARGLLQWDCAVASFDLHPVVRGYAIGVLDTKARGAAGERVADHFFARAEPDYERVTSMHELADRMQGVQALCLAGQTQRAWDLLRGTTGALYRLEGYHEALALLRPFFPDGWLAPPSGVADGALVANDAAVALAAVGWRQEEEAQTVFAIRDEIGRGLSSALGLLVRNHHYTVANRNEPARAAHILGLASDIAAALDHGNLLLLYDTNRVIDSAGRGALDDARHLWTDMASRPAWQQRDARLETQCLAACRT